MGNSKKKPLRIAVPTDDGITIFRGMLGRAKNMYIYEIEEGSRAKLIEKRTNPYSETMQHLKTLDVYELISDCSIIVSTNIGKKGVDRLKAKGVKLLFKKGNILKALFDIIKDE